MYMRLSDEIQFCDVKSSISQNPVVWGGGTEWVFGTAEWSGYKTTTDCGSCTPLCGRAGASEQWRQCRMRSESSGKAHLAYRACERCGRNAKPARGEKRLDGGEKGHLGWQVLRARDEMEKDDVSTHTKSCGWTRRQLHTQIAPAHLCALCSEECISII